MTSALPVSVAPRPGESIESWLEHLADANGLTTAQLLTATGRGRDGNRYLTLAPSPETITRLAALARVDEQDVYAATLAAFDGTALDLTGLDPADRHSYRQVSARGWAPAHGTQICPTCLAETGAWRTTWRLLIVTACTRHRTLLVARCPACRRPFRDQRHSHLRRVGAALVCGNPLGDGPTRQCQHDLTTIATTPADEAVMLTQRRVDAALDGHDIEVLGQPACPAAYLTDLRHLTTLMLHLAGQPGATDLAHWPATLAHEAEQRTGDRGPRWGLRPPDDPGVRGAALATADAILAAPDVDAAAAALTPWSERRRVGSPDLAGRRGDASAGLSGHRSQDRAPALHEPLVQRVGPTVPPRHPLQQRRLWPDLAMGQRRPRPPRPLTRLARVMALR